MPVEGLVVHEGRPLTPARPIACGSVLGGGLRKSSNRRRRPSACRRPDRWRSIGRIQGRAAGVAALLVGLW